MVLGSDRLTPDLGNNHVNQDHPLGHADDVRQLPNPHRLRKRIGVMSKAEHQIGEAKPVQEVGL
ncbi:hypothetical protein D3C72_2224130 [compost metagenome]